MLRQASLLVWQVLIACAANRQTISYGQIAKTIGLRQGAPLIGPYLDSSRCSV